MSRSLSQEKLAKLAEFVRLYFESGKWFESRQIKTVVRLEETLGIKTSECCLFFTTKCCIFFTTLNFNTILSKQKNLSFHPYIGGTMKFGELVKSKRLELGKSLRKFCEENDYDPGNHSKLERGLLKAPQEKQSLRKLALSLEIKENTDDWEEFMDAAFIDNDTIPDYVPNDKEVLEMLPVFFRTTSGKKVPKDKLDKLIELIKRT